MVEENSLNYQAALRDFQYARRQAAIHHLLAQLTGKSDELLAYNEVRQQLRGTETIDRGVQEIPLEAIVGSVGRYKDFTREFLPKKDSIQERWVRVKTAFLNVVGMKPISVYQIGECYFVRDGNHRVSVTRQLGTTTISAHVTEVKTKVPLALGDDIDKVQCKASYVEFLEKTKLDESRPEANLLMTFCDQYPVFLSQIESYRQKHSASGPDPAAQWYDKVYLPVVKIIRRQGTLHHFPERTEADLYLLFVEHQSELRQALGWQIDMDTTVTHLIEGETLKPHSVTDWLSSHLYHVLVPDEFHPGPEPGHWRKEHLDRRGDESLFSSIVVGVGKDIYQWQALDHAITIAKRENSSLYGLHVRPTKKADDDDSIQALRSAFDQRCQADGIKGELSVETGKVAKTILKRAAMVDLVVLSLNHPPRTQPAKGFGAGFKLLVQRCPRPLLVVPSGASSTMERAMLAYDGSPKADEALFVAAYLGLRWSTNLTVVTIKTKYTPSTALDQARVYLDKQGVPNVTYLLRLKPIGDSLLEAAESHDANLLIMGGFGFRPVMNLVLGSTVNQVLSEYKQPVLICR
jgi:nucleotide-binding universal stress UspA family protein